MFDISTTAESFDMQFSFSASSGLGLKFENSRAVIRQCTGIIMIKLATVAEPEKGGGKVRAKS
jgi:hypothetical protein